MLVPERTTFVTVDQRPRWRVPASAFSSDVRGGRGIRSCDALHERVAQLPASSVWFAPGGLRPPSARGDPCRPCLSLRGRGGVDLGSLVAWIGRSVDAGWRGRASGAPSLRRMVGHALTSAGHALDALPGGGSLGARDVRSDIRSSYCGLHVTRRRGWSDMVTGSCAPRRGRDRERYGHLRQRR